MNRIELMQTRTALRSRLDEMERIKPVCGMCAHLSSQGLCDMFGEKPPAAAMSQDIDCQAWEFDNVPF